MTALELLVLLIGITFSLYSIRYFVFICWGLFKRLERLDADGWNENDQSEKGGDNPGHPTGDSKEPFVSVHLPLYNEKNVVDRLLEACTSLNYGNYEVIVVDDSTDETPQILKKWKSKRKIRVLHRKDRTGFKGGALNQAIEKMSPQTEYVIVFDADFIPPPDIIQQFLSCINTPSKDDGKNAAVQGYQWHCLNEEENWVTRAIRVEYSGSYMIERTCQEQFGLMKMIAGSVFMVKADLLRKYCWTTSITEDWELTLRLYVDGYKIIYTPLIAAKAECPSTMARLIKQRMRWAEGHTRNIRKYFTRILTSQKISNREKAEFIYYTPYYLQSVLFLVGTLFWLLLEFSNPSPLINPIRLIILFNFLSLPLMGLAGLHLENSLRRSSKGVFSWIILPYFLAPFQCYASLKGLLLKKGGWIRTYKTGKITRRVSTRSRIASSIRRLIGWKKKEDET